MRIPLRLNPATSGPSPQPTAWFVPGAEPDTWLAEIRRWGLPLDVLRMLPVPHARGSDSPRGVVVLVEGGARPRNVLRAQSYSDRAGILFHPSDATVSPPVSDTELRELASWDRAVLHPSVGLIGYRRSDVLRVEDLCTRPRDRGSSWDRADPGIAIGSRILGIEPEDAISIDDFIEEGGEDIASGTPRDLPRRPGESWLPAFPAIRPFRPLARAVLWFTARAPIRASEPTWINRLEDWASAALASGDRRGRRARELERLVKLLDEDPDRGLRFALPIDAGAGRGSASPGDTLDEHDTDFSLRRLRSARPADVWNAPPEMQWQLHTRYRELANRELALGRHRRAAYVFGHLLNDFSSAAKALREGRHYREAAALYERRLGNLEDAGRCLEQGGLTTEAIALFERVGNFERAGDLYAKLDAPEEAERAFHEAVTRCMQAGDEIGAARILERKTVRPDRALVVLDRAWPCRPGSHRCLLEIFALLGRHAWHDHAARRVAELRAIEPTEHRAAAAGVLIDVASRYPDAGIRHAAADTARVITSSVLGQVNDREQRALLNGLRTLARNDRLLARDVQRYANRIVTPGSSKPARRTARVVHAMPLPTGIDWCVAAASPRAVVVAGRNDRGEVRVVVARWGERFVTVFEDSTRSTGPLTAEASNNTRLPLIVTVLGEEPRRLAIDDEVPRLEATSRDLPAHAAGITGHDLDSWVVASWENGQLVLTDNDYLLMRTVALPAIRVDDRLPASALPMAYSGDRIHLGLGTTLYSVPDGRTASSMDLAFPIRSLQAAAHHAGAGVLATMERGVALVDTSGRPATTAHVAQDLDEPAAGFGSGGHVVVAGDGEMRVYRSHENRLRPWFWLEEPARGVFGVVRGPKRNQCALVSKEAVHLMQL